MRQYCRVICTAVCLLTIHSVVLAQTNAFANGYYNPYAFQESRQAEKTKQFNESLNKAGHTPFKSKEVKTIKAPSSEPSKSEIERMRGVNKCISGDCENGFGVFEYKKPPTNKPWDITHYGTSDHYYEGHFIGAKPDGIGRMYDYRGKLSYVGEYKKGERDGKGFSINYDNTGDLQSTYEGDYIDGVRDGYGITIDYHRNNPNGYYLGNWKKGKKEGYGVDSLSYKPFYKGEFIAGKKEGKGMVYWASYLIAPQMREKGAILKYDGEWKDDKMHGTGIEFDNTGKKIFEGSFSNDKRNGTGKEYTSDGTVSEGTWANGVKN